MPKRPAKGHTVWRDEFVEQMRRLQEARDLTDGALASRVSRHYPMTAATVWKLKNATPARGLSLDEALAITYAFGFTSMDQFLSTWTTAGLAQDRVTLAREQIIIYAQTIDTRDILAKMREADEALEVATGNGQRLKAEELSNLQAGVARLRVETVRLVEVVTAAADKIDTHAEHLEQTIQANQEGEQ